MNCNNNPIICTPNKDEQEIKQFDKLPKKKYQPLEMIQMNNKLRSLIIL